MFLALNGYTLRVNVDAAVSTMLAIAAGELEAGSIATLLRDEYNPVLAAKQLGHRPSPNRSERHPTSQLTASARPAFTGFAY